MKLALIVTVFENLEYLENCLTVPLESERFSEFVIVDDCSQSFEMHELEECIRDIAIKSGFEVTEREKILKKQSAPDQQDLNEIITFQIEKSHANVSKRVEIVRNGRNLGSFRNKVQATEYVHSDWCLLFDSDNALMTASIESLPDLRELDPENLYCPEKLVFTRGIGGNMHVVSKYSYKHFPVIPKICGARGFNEVTITRWLRSGSETLESRANFFLNTGNFFFARDSFTRYVASKFVSDWPEATAACSIAIVTYWMEAGGGLRILPRFTYLHGLRNDSYWETAKNHNEIAFYSARLAALETSCSMHIMTTALTPKMRLQLILLRSEDVLKTVSRKIRQVSKSWCDKKLW